MYFSSLFHLLKNILIEHLPFAKHHDRGDTRVGTANMEALYVHKAYYISQVTLKSTLEIIID